MQINTNYLLLILILIHNTIYLLLILILIHNTNYLLLILILIHNTIYLLLLLILIHNTNYLLLILILIHNTNYLLLILILIHNTNYQTHHSLQRRAPPLGCHTSPVIRLTILCRAGRHRWVVTRHQWPDSPFTAAQGATAGLSHVTSDQTHHSLQRRAPPLGCQSLSRCKIFSVTCCVNMVINIIISHMFWNFNI